MFGGEFWLLSPGDPAACRRCYVHLKTMEPILPWPFPWNMLKICALNFNIMRIEKSYGLLTANILRRIRSKGASWSFTPSDFADAGDPRSVGMTLTRLMRKGVIRRVRRGVYDVPRKHPLLGTAGAGPDAITQAIARRDGLKLLPSGAHAANALGLSTQVPARTTYGVAGRSRVVPTGGRAAVTLHQRSPKAMALAGRASGWIAAALRNLGQDHITPDRLRHLRASLDSKQRRELLADLRYVPAWMRPHFQELARDE